MKKLLAILLALTFIVSMFAMTACSDDTPKDTDAKTDDTNEPAGSGDDTNTPEDTDDPDDADESTDTDEPTAEVGPNEYPYEHGTDFEILSVEYWDWGAPRENSVYFEIDADHIIHDGKGTWRSAEDAALPATLPAQAFDGDDTTFYDCDENANLTNYDEENAGIVPETPWDATQTGYVGAWIESGVILHQIRWMPRSGMESRATGCKFQASVDGVNWVDLATVEEDPNTYDVTMIDIDDDTVYYYVRFLSRDLAAYQQYVDETATEATDFRAYCNIAELEIWGEKPAA